MRRADVYYRNMKAGQLVEDENGYLFCYDAEYLSSEQAEPISLTLPLTSATYKSPFMFPFFDGLIPEGWLLDIASRTWKLNPNDRMGLIMNCCRECVGAIEVIGLKEDEPYV